MTYILCPDHRITAKILTPDQLNRSLRIAAETLISWNSRTTRPHSDKAFEQLWHDRKGSLLIEELKRYQLALSSEWTHRIAVDAHMHKYMQRGVMKGVPKQGMSEHPANDQFKRSLSRLVLTGGPSNAPVLRTRAQWPDEVFKSHQCAVLREDYANTHLKFIVNGLEIPNVWQLYPFYHGTPRAIANENHAGKGIHDSEQGRAQEVSE